MIAHFALRRAAGLAVAAGAALLAACTDGGGSSDTGSGAPPGPPPPPPSATSQTFATAESTARFLTQATFGPSLTDINAATGTDVSDWMVGELSKPATTYLDRLLQNVGVTNNQVPNHLPRDLYWNSMVTADDQLRQRMVFALSQILVVSSEGGGLNGAPLTMAAYMDVLSNNAFGNFRDLLEDVTYSYAMGRYLTYYRNRKGDMESGRVPDENYAREIMQLFTIGLVELNLDGTRRLSGGEPIETYDNQDVTELAKVFTGLSRKGSGFFNADADGDYRPMQMFDEQHSELEKSFLGTTIPAGAGGEASIDLALDALVAHPNVAPFISRQLIQRFVTSNPTPAYVRRVAMAFEEGVYRLPDGRDVGTMERGDLSATIAAILLDDDARDPASAAADDFGKVREPVLRFVQWARAFDAGPVNATNERWLRDSNDVTRLSQQPFRSPSVFNFYRPGYVAPGTATGAAGLTAPELQIVNETSIAGYVNFMSRFVRDDSPKFDGDAASFSPDYATELDLAADPAGLVDHLDLLLTGGRMRDDVRQRIIDVVAEVPLPATEDAEARAERVHLAVLMAVTSPEYLVQR